MVGEELFKGSWLSGGSGNRSDFNKIKEGEVKYFVVADEKGEMAVYKVKAKKEIQVDMNTPLSNEMKAKLVKFVAQYDIEEAEFIKNRRLVRFTKLTREIREVFEILEKDPQGFKAIALLWIARRPLEKVEPW